MEWPVVFYIIYLSDISQTVEVYFAYYKKVNMPLFMHLSMSSPRGGGRATHGTLTLVCIPRVGILIGHYAFYLSILKSRREENHFFLLILTILFRPGWGF